VESVVQNQIRDDSAVRERPTADRIRAAARRAWPALAVYLAIRVVSSVVYAVLTEAFGARAHRNRPLFTAVDGGWYHLIGTYGYNTVVSAHDYGSIFGFFPLYPGLMHYGADVTGLPVNVVGLIVTWLSAAAAAWGLFEIGRLLHDARTGIVLAALWAVAPSAIIESMLYADTLAVALSAWALYALLRRWWLTAGICAALAGLTRPTASSVVVVVGVGAILAVARRQDGWRPWIGGLLAPTGLIAFFLYVDARTNSLTGYFKEQKDGWGSYFDGGRSTFSRVAHGLMLSSGYVTEARMITTVVLVLVPIMIVVQILTHQPWQLIGYTIVSCIVVYGTVHIYTTSPRELLPLFPLLIPPAVYLAKPERRILAYSVISVLAVASGWYAGYVTVMTGHPTLAIP
jgi:hypothetical protein